LIASIGGHAGISDVSAAFGQSLKGQRGGKRLFANPPPEGLPGESDDILIELLTEVYGLVSGPPGWRKTLLTKFKDLEFARHPLAPCVVLMYETLGGKPKSLSGLVVIETDDLLFGGVGPKYLQGIEAMRKSFTFGAWHDLRLAPKQYGGVTIHQMKDCGFTISMSRYLNDNPRQIKIDRGKDGRRDQEELANPGEVTGMRAVIGVMNWACRKGCPQGSGDVSILATKLPNPQVKDLVETNAALKRLQATADTPIKIVPIPLHRMVTFIFTDASLGNVELTHSQLAYLGGGSGQRFVHRS